MNARLAHLNLRIRRSRPRPANTPPRQVATTVVAGSERGMHPEEIKAAMRMAGTTPAMLATKLGVSSATVSTVIHGRAESARIKASIAKLIGKPIAVIWPGAARKSLQRPKGSVPARKRARA